MEQQIITVFSIAGTVIVIGFLANALFRKTGFSDTVFLLFIGIVLGPILQIFSYQALLSIIPFLSNLALAMILFDGGLHMSLRRVLSQSLRSTILGGLYVFFVTISVSLFTHFVMGLPWFEALMLGPMIAGTSSVVIIPLVSKLDINKQVQVTLSLESAITDVLNIILLVTILEMYLNSFVNLQEAVLSLVTQFTVGTVLGIFFGIFWIKAFYLARKMEHTYILMTAILLICYALSEVLGGSGALSALFFGLVLGNDKDVIKILRMKIELAPLSYVKGIMRRFHGELSFLIKTFFFVFLGLIYQISGISIGLIYQIIPISFLTSILYGLIFIGIALILRYVAVWVSTINSPMSSYRILMTFLCGQGLVPATLSVIIYEELLRMGIEYAYIYPVVATNFIIMTNIVTSIALPLHKFLKKSFA